MKKSTKKMVSSVLAASMIFGSVLSPVNVFATEYTASNLEGLSCTVATAGTTKTTTWTFASTEAADKDGTVNGVEDTKITVGDTLEGIVVTGDEGNAKSWNSSNLFSVSKTMGFKLPVSDGCTGGTIKVTATGKNTDRYLLLNGDSSKTIAYTKGENTLTFTASDIVDGYLVLTNNPSGGDYKMSQIVLEETIDSTATTQTTTVATTTETTTATTTEATTKEVTTEVTTQATTVVTTTETTTVATTAETTTEATTTAPVDDSSLLDSKLNSATSAELKDYASGATIIDGLTAKVALSVATDGGASFTDKDGNEYTYSKATEENNCLAAQANGDAIEYVAPADGTVKIAFKVNASKTGTVFGEEVTAGTKSTYLYREYTVKKGQSYTAGLSGSKIRIFYFGFTADGDTTTEATTEATTVATTVAPTTEATTEATTTAPVSSNLGVKVSVADSDAQTVGGVQKISSSKVGSTVKVNVDVTSGDFNNYTFFIKYNPKVLEAKSVADVDDIANYATVNGKVAYSASLVNSSISYVPSVSNADYADVNADGKTSAAKLGKIKLANYLGDEATGLATATAGRLVSLDFTVVGEGSSDIEIVLVENGFYGAPGANNVITVDKPVNASVIVTADKTETTETTTETTTLVPDGVLGVKATPSSSAKLSADGGIVAEVGDKVTINIDTVNADQVPYNNYTFFISYNPEVMEAVEAVVPENPAKSASGNVAYNISTINNSIALQPSVDNPDYADLVADVTTSPSAAELGRVKLAGIVGDLSGDGHETISVDGSVCAISFVVKSLGDADFKIELVDNGFYGDVSSPAISVQAVDSKIVFVEDTVTIPTGDIDMEDPWTANDASELLQKVLDSSYVLPCEKAYPDSFYYIADVDADGMFSANDAAVILGYVLDSSTGFPITDAIANGTYVYPTNN